MFKKVSIVLVGLMLLLAFAGACSQAPAPAPTVTVTSQAPAPAPGPAPTVTVTTQAPAPAPAPTQHPTKSVTILSALQGTSTYSIAFGTEEIAKKNHPWLRVQALEGQGNIANMRFLEEYPDRWQDTIVLTGGWDRSLAYQGLTEGLPKGSGGNLRMLTSIIPHFSVFVTFDPNIKTVMDLKGKKVAIGLRTQTTYGFHVENALRLGTGYDTTKDVNVQWVGTTKTYQALLDGLVDATIGTFYSDGNSPPKLLIAGTDLQQLMASGKKLYFVDWTLPVLQQAAKASGFNYDGVSPLPAGAFEMLDSPVYRLGTTTGWWVNKTFPEEVAYEFTKLYLDHASELVPYHSIAKVFNPDTFMLGATNDNTHEGAIRAYKEAGVWKGQ